MGERTRKKEIQRLLTASNWEEGRQEIIALPASQTISPLIGNLCAVDQQTKSRAIAALGQVVAKLADQDMEAARVVMRRFMYMLNDESGGIGWGVPEAFAEILTCHDGLAAEYAHILVSFMREDGFYLEYEPMQRGLLWGIGRLAEVHPELLHKFNAAQYLPPYLNSQDTEVRELAGQALAKLKERKT